MVSPTQSFVSEMIYPGFRWFSEEKITISRSSPKKGTTPLERLGRRRKRPIRVAVLVAQFTDLIDLAGPWEVFAQTYADDGKPYFHLYSVASDRMPRTLWGGLVVVPEYALQDAPTPDIVLVPALGVEIEPRIVDWIREAHGGGSVIVSICVGARELAEAGILDGLTATTHHGALSALKANRPAVHVVGGRRFVRASSTIYTAGGLTSGIDLALHLVRRIFGLREARAVAQQLEYEGRRWESAEPRSRGRPRSSTGYDRFKPPR